MRRKLLFPLLFLAIPLAAQRIENIKAEVFGEGEKVVVTYDINGAASGQKFKISLYGSHNNYSAPLTLVSGDVGREVLGGPNKRIEWSAKSELKDFIGDITFEVRGEILAAPFAFQTPAGGGKVKRGKTAEITWTGGAPGENVRLELLQGGTVINQVASTTNSQRFSWPVPKSTAKAGNYQMRLSGESGTVTSGTFAVKSKTAAIVKVLPFLVVGGVVAWLVTKDDGGGNGSSDLPNPPTYNGD